jgi:acyl-ACP thioesterase
VAIGRAKGLWIFFDIQNRKPVPVFEEITDRWSFFKKNALSVKVPPQITPLNKADYSEEIIVRSSDVDIYQHANNIRYLQWLIDSIPEDTTENFTLNFIEGKFLSEIKSGDTAVMLTHLAEDVPVYNHTIKIKETDRICAVARTKWKSRMQDS